MKTLPLLLKREYWEHRGGFLWTPVWITAAILIITVFGMVTAEVFNGKARVHFGFSLDELRANIGAAELVKAAQGLDMAQLMLFGITCVGLFFVTFFYLLGALYDDRRDRSVLFWKSLPVSDTATVVSKAVAAALLMPAIALVVATLAYLVFLAMICLWAAMHGLNALPAVADAHPLGIFLRLLAMLPVQALWALPAIGWLLFWSAFARSKPFLWAVLLPIVVIFVDRWIGMLSGYSLLANFDATIIGRLLLSVLPGSWMGAKSVLTDGVSLSLGIGSDAFAQGLNPIKAYGLLLTANLQLGVLCGLALLASAIWLRGRRIETSV